MTDKRVNVLGVVITPTNMKTAVQTIARWIACREQQYVCVTGLHGVTESLRDISLKRIHNQSGMTVPDGMPMVWLSRWAGFRDVTRVYGPDLMLAVCAKGYRHFFYGGAPGVPEQLGQVLQRRFANLHVCGTYSPPFRPLTPAEDADITAMINNAAPDILWIGLSTPKQERWMADHVGRLTVPVMIGVGAAFDIHTHRVRQAPLWMQQRGLEWFFRLLQEPRRLWRRYLVGNTLFLWHLLWQRLGWHDYPLDGS